MSPSRLKIRPSSLFKLSAMSLVVAALSGCGEDAKDCGGRWDKMFGREECAVNAKNQTPLTKSTQSIANLNLSVMKTGEKITLNAKASSGLPITYNTKTSNICTVNGAEVTAIAQGECTIEATQVGDDKFLPVTTTVTQQVAPLVCEAPQLISENKTSCYTPEGVKKGVFVDSPVEGLRYQTATFSGITDKKGSFYYLAGENVSFGLGQYALGIVEGKDYVFVEALNRTLADKTADKAMRVAQLLQTLDVDSNPDNGIVLDKAVQNYFGASTEKIDFYVSDAVYEAAMNQLLSPLKKTLVSLEQAQKHAVASQNAIPIECDFPSDTLTILPSYIRNINYSTGEFIDNYPSVAAKNTLTSCNDKAYYYLWTNRVEPAITAAIYDSQERMNKIIGDNTEAALKEAQITKSIDSLMDSSISAAQILELQRYNVENKAQYAIGLMAGASVLTKGLDAAFSQYSAFVQTEPNKRAEIVKGAVDAITQSTACLGQVGNDWISECLGAIKDGVSTYSTVLANQLDDPQKQEIYKTAVKDILSVLSDTASVNFELQNNRIDKAAVVGAIGRIAGSIVNTTFINMQYSESEGKQFIYNTLIQGALIPVLKSANCFNLSISSCLEDTVKPVLRELLVKNIMRWVGTANLKTELANNYALIVAKAIINDMVIYGGLENSNRYLRAKYGWDNRQESTLTYAEIRKLAESVVRDYTKNGKTTGIFNQLGAAATNYLDFATNTVNETADAASKLVTDNLKELYALKANERDLGSYINLTATDNSSGLSSSYTIDFIAKFGKLVTNHDGYATIKCYAQGSNRDSLQNAVSFSISNVSRQYSSHLDFNQAGSKSIICDLFDDNGFVSRARQTVIVSEPVLAVRWIAEGITNNQVMLNAPIKFRLEDATHALLVKWNFGGNTFVTTATESVIYRFETEAEHTVTAEVIDIFGTVTQYTQVLNVAKPKINLNLSETPVVGQSITMTLSHYWTGLKSAVWQFFNALGELIDTLTTNLDEAVTRAFDQTGNHKVSVVVQDVTDTTIASNEAIFYVGSHQLSVSPNQVVRTQTSELLIVASGEFVKLPANLRVETTGGVCSEPINANNDNFKLNCQFDAVGEQGIKIFNASTNQVLGTVKIQVTESEPPVQVTGLLNDTGITQCSNESTVFANCTAASMGGWFGLNQDAQLGRDALAAQGQLSKKGSGDAGFDFSKISATGVVLPANATQWSCVQDNHTGLMWEVKTDDGGLHDRDNRYTWYNTNAATNGGTVGYENGGNNTQVFVQTVNAQGLCGYKDWRLPTQQELHSIVNYGKYNPAIDTTYFANTVSNVYWSSSPNAYDSIFVWVIDLSYGNGYSNYKSSRHYVSLVRSSQ